MKTGSLYLGGIKVRNCSIRLELPVEMFASGSGWNGASPGHGWAVLGDREDCLNPAFITGEKIAAYFGHRFSFDGASYRFYSALGSAFLCSSTIQ